MRRFECPYCSECPTTEEWNEYNRVAVMVLGYATLPQGYDEQDDASSMDCPACEERVVLTDLTEV